MTQAVGKLQKWTAEEEFPMWVDIYVLLVIYIRYVPKILRLSVKDKSTRKSPLSNRC